MAGKRAAALLLLAWCCLGAQAIDTALWARDVAALMGDDTKPASGGANPQGILQTHQAANPASGIKVASNPQAQPVKSQHMYAWTGPVAAGDGQLGLAKQHPILALSLQTMVFLKTLGVIREIKDRRRSPSPSPIPSPSPSPSPPPPVPEFFVQVDNGQFISGVNVNNQCRYLFPAGFNKFEFVEAGAGAPILFDAQLKEPGLTGPATVRRMLDQAKSSGLNLLRMNAFAVDSQYSVARQPAGSGTPLVFNEGVLKGLDYVLDQVQQRGMKVILVFTDYFADGAGGPLQYLAFAGAYDPTSPCSGSTSPTCDEVKAKFFTNVSLAKQYYQQYVQLVIERTNTVNGRVYKDDPTIWGIDLMNEPRCQDPSICSPVAAPTLIDTWVAEQSAFVKTKDSKHLVTVGLDGFYLNPPGSNVNPFPNTYATDWVSTNTPATIDFLEFNTYPDQWVSDPNNYKSFAESWIAQHSADAKSPLQRPAIIKEFGAAPTNQRLNVYNYVLNATRTTMTLDAGAIGGLKGGLYFQGWVQGTEAANFTLNINGGRFGILPTDPVYGTAVYSELQSFATFAKQLQDQQIFTCPANKPLLAPVFPPAPNCPAGYEGPNCADINECVRGTDDCSVNAACINTPGSFTCQCFLGFTGNGKVCIADVPAQDAIADKFKTEGKVITSSFSPVTYPSTAPGWVYDPTETSQPSQSHVPVDLRGCQLACETAGEAVCTSFQYNEISKRCELRSGECPFQQQPTTDAYCTNPRFLPDVPTQQGTQQDLCGRVVSYYRKVYTLPPGCNPIP